MPEPAIEEITAVKKLKSKHPSALWTVEDLQCVFNMATELSEDDEVNSSEISWNEEDDYPENSDIVYMAAEDLKQVETQMSNSAFLLGCEAGTESHSIFLTSERRPQTDNGEQIQRLDH